KLVSALLATVFENRHTLTPISQRTDAAFPSPAREWYNHYRCSPAAPTFLTTPARKAWLTGQRVRIAPRRPPERTIFSVSLSARGGCSSPGTLRPLGVISCRVATSCHLPKSVCSTWN